MKSVQEKTKLLICVIASLHLLLMSVFVLSKLSNVPRLSCEKQQAIENSRAP